MGVIVTLPQPRRRRTAATATTSDATILLFMGVRYVRDTEAAGSEVSVPETIPDRAETHPPLEIA